AWWPVPFWAERCAWRSGFPAWADGWKSVSTWKGLPGGVTFPILYHTGAMAIIGAVSDSLREDPSTLIAKAVMDAIISVAAAASMGISAAFSAVLVFLYQGAISVCAGLLEPYLSAALLNDISMVGYALLICLGLNFACGSKIKTADTLPSLLIPILFNVLSVWRK
ncbi:MAG: DUF554 family protein, partial [Oscillospiraceae bacterium]|nr:DUF554 family protein [Oscillospiraceae bacterium]